jgi:hypothetical protein
MMPTTLGLRASSRMLCAFATSSNVAVHHPVRRVFVRAFWAHSFLHVLCAQWVKAGQAKSATGFGIRQHSSYNLETAAMEEIVAGPVPGSGPSSNMLVFVLATCMQNGKEQLVLLSTQCPDTRLYTITLPYAQMRAHEDTGLTASRALLDAGIRSSSVVRNGAGVAIHPGGFAGRVVVESMTINSLDGLSPGVDSNVAVVMAPVDALRRSLTNLSNEGRIIDENLFFFAAGMETATGGIPGATGEAVSREQRARATADQVARAKNGPDFVTRFAPMIGGAWMAGAVAYAVSCMQFAY